MTRSLAAELSRLFEAEALELDRRSFRLPPSEAADLDEESDRLSGIASFWHHKSLERTRFQRRAPVAQKGSNT